MASELPRVTYSNIGVDFSQLHAYLDVAIAQFEERELGQTRAVPSATGAARRIVSPVDGKTLIGTFADSTPQDVDAAIARARHAFPKWSSLAFEQRLSFAERWKEELAKRKYEIAIGALFEIGKSRMEAVGEAEEASDIVEYYASEMRRNGGYTQPMNELIKNESAKSVMRPYGVFGVIAPFNFPVALSVNMIAGALLTGNTVIYKPSPDCALVGLMIAETLGAAGIPQGAFNLVLGGPEVGEALVSSPLVSGIAFTGSHKTGTSIFRYLASLTHAKPLIADMGGKNPAYVTRNANITTAAEGVARSAFGLQGQKCSACSVVYVDRSVKDEFVKAICAFAEKLKVGDPRERETFIGPLYNEQTVGRFKAAVLEAREEGVVHFGGESLSDDETTHYFSPAIVELAGSSRLTRDELFMPFLVIRPVDSLEDALEEGNDVIYGLSAGIYSEQAEDVAYFLDHAQAGVLYANRKSGATTGAWPGSQPFCGWKGSGVSGKGGLGPHYLTQFMREQSHTVMNKH